MREKTNWKSLAATLIILVAGLIMAFMDVFVWESPSSIVANIGCSLIASSGVGVVTVLLVERQRVNPLDEWKLVKIYNTRAERNSEADPSIEQTQYRIDGIAFGLSTFRTMYGAKIEQCLKKGVQIRLITMDPDGLFISEREDEEKTAHGGIKNTITDLVDWANKLNQSNYQGKVVVKAYKSMTLDYYWRVDNELYIGPYWYGYKSSDTITYKFQAGGRGFQHYCDYFEKLWNDKDLCRVLTAFSDASEPKAKQNKRSKNQS